MSVSSLFWFDNGVTGIVPCGIEGHGVTSLVDLGLPVTIEDFDLALKQAFGEVFGPLA